MVRVAGLLPYLLPIVVAIATRPASNTTTATTATTTTGLPQHPDGKDSGPTELPYTTGPASEAAATTWGGPLVPHNNNNNNNNNTGSRTNERSPQPALTTTTAGNANTSDSNPSIKRDDETHVDNETHVKENGFSSVERDDFSKRNGTPRYPRKKRKALESDGLLSESTGYTRLTFDGLPEEIQMRGMDLLEGEPKTRRGGGEKEKGHHKRHRLRHGKRRRHERGNKELLLDTDVSFGTIVQEGHGKRNTRGREEGRLSIHPSSLYTPQEFISKSHNKGSVSSHRRQENNRNEEQQTDASSRAMMPKQQQHRSHDSATSSRLLSLDHSYTHQPLPSHSPLYRSRETVPQVYDHLNGPKADFPHGIRLLLASPTATEVSSLGNRTPTDEDIDLKTNAHQETESRITSENITRKHVDSAAMVAKSAELPEQGKQPGGGIKRDRSVSRDFIFLSSGNLGSTISREVKNSGDDPSDSSYKRQAINLGGELRHTSQRNLKIFLKDSGHESVHNKYYINETEQESRFAKNNHTRIYNSSLPLLIRFSSRPQVKHLNGTQGRKGNKEGEKWLRAEEQPGTEVSPRVEPVQEGSVFDSRFPAHAPSGTTDSDLQPEQVSSARGSDASPLHPPPLAASPTGRAEGVAEAGQGGVRTSGGVVVATRSDTDTRSILHGMLSTPSTNVKLKPSPSKSLGSPQYYQQDEPSDSSSGGSNEDLAFPSSCYSVNDMVVAVLVTSLVNVVVLVLVTMVLCWCSLRGRHAAPPPRPLRPDEQHEDDEDTEETAAPEGCLEACLPDISYQRHIARGSSLRPSFVVGRALRPLVHPQPPRISQTVHELLHNLTTTASEPVEKKGLIQRRSLSLENLSLT